MLRQDAVEAVSALQPGYLGPIDLTVDAWFVLPLQGATKLFSWLKGCEPDRMGGVHRHLPYDSNKAEKHAKFCYDNIERAAQHLNHEKMKADQQQEVRERHQRALEKVNATCSFAKCISLVCVIFPSCEFCSLHISGTSSPKLDFNKVIYQHRKCCGQCAFIHRALTLERYDSLTDENPRSNPCFGEFLLSSHHNQASIAGATASPSPTLGYIIPKTFHGT